MRALLAGLGLAAVVTALLRLSLGPAALVPAAAFGTLAALIQAVAGWAQAKWPPPARGIFGGGWVLGFFLRLGGVALFAVAAGLRPDRFAPLPAALGFLGVLVPLLVLETRNAR
jgi:hypothetical protein